MLRAAVLLSFLRRLQRFSTIGHPKALVACHVAPWQLPRPNFHRLADDSLSGHTSDLLGCPPHNMQNLPQDYSLARRPPPGCACPLARKAVHLR